MSSKNKTCRVCDTELNDDNWTPSRKKGNRRICKECDNTCHRAWQKANPNRRRELLQAWRKANPDKNREQWTRYTRKKGYQSLNKNKKCTLFLGVHVAERVLSHVFKDVERMPNCNRGYDFVCNRGKKIDVKSSCRRKNNAWAFHINKNRIADYFLCIAFDNREDLTPLHVWLIPGEVVNHLISAGISSGTLSKWNDYLLDISKVVTCCDTLRDQSNTTTSSPSLRSPAAIHSIPSSR